MIKLREMRGVVEKWEREREVQLKRENTEREGERGVVERERERGVVERENTERERERQEERCS